MSLDLANFHAQVVAERPFAALLGVTEDAFVVAGNCLQDSLTQLHALKAMFGSLDAHIGAEANAFLIQQVADLSVRDERLRSDFDAFGTRTQGLRKVIQGMRSEIGELNTIIRLVTNISINARIQGNSLSRPRPQINSFVETLSGLASTAETILAEINGAMAAATTALKQIETAQISLADDLRKTAFPAIARFTETAKAISAEQGALRESSATIDDRMQRISADVAPLVMSLQIGDTLRQRLEQVHAALLLAGPTDGTRGVALRLAGLLAAGAIRDAKPMIDDALDALVAISKRSSEIAGAANESAFANGALRRAGLGQDHLDSLRRGLAISKEHFGVMQDCGQVAQHQLSQILGRERDLHHIAVQLRMASVNAVIACAKLGDEGRAMRELAQWLRAITDEFYDTITRLQSALHDAGRTTEEMGDTLITRLDADLGAFQEVASGLGTAIDTARKVLLGTSSQFDRVAGNLSARLQSARTSLALVRTKMDESHRAIQMLENEAALHPVFDTSAPALPSYLASIRRKYTMAAERTIHDDLVASLNIGISAAVPEATVHTKPSDESGVDDLDDILF